MDKTIKISESTYEAVRALSKKERRNIKTIVDLAVEQYQKAATNDRKQ